MAGTKILSYFFCIFFFFNVFYINKVSDVCLCPWAQRAMVSAIDGMNRRLSLFER